MDQLILGWKESDYQANIDLLRHLDSVWLARLQVFQSQKIASLSRYRKDVDNGTTSKQNFTNWAARNDPGYITEVHSMRDLAAQYQQAIEKIKGAEGKGEQDEIERMLEESIEDSTL